MLLRWRPSLSQRSAGRRRWRAPWIVAALLIPVVILRIAGLVDIAAVEVFLALVVPLAAVMVLAGPVQARRSVRQWLAVAGVASITFVASTVPGLDALLPGAPLAQGHVEAVGDVIQLPEGLEGRVRMLVHVELPIHGEALVAVRLSGTKGPFEARFERTVSRQQTESGSRRRVWFRDPESRYFTVAIPVGTERLRVEKLVGQPRDPVRIEIFRPPLGTAWVVAAGLVTLLLVVLVGIRLPLRENALPAAAFALCFGLVFAGGATPGSALRPAVGALVLGVFIGGSLGSVLSRVATRWLHGGKTPQPRDRASLKRS